jgi:signal recognition particle receptor subunit beta
MHVNHEDRVVMVKVVYYGPALGGKTTNLEAIHRITDPDQRSTLISLKTEGDRTLFFDLLPFDLGSLMGFQFGFKLYTVPGQIRYAATRKKVLEGADGVVFVADSQSCRGEDNRKSLADLRTNLRANGIDLDSVPLVLQYNKQDLTDLMTIQELNADLNARGASFFKSVAIQGKGVLATLAAIVQETIQAALACIETRSEGVNDQELHQFLQKAFSPYFERAKQLSGEFRAIGSRFKEVYISSRDVEGSCRPDGPIRDDKPLDPIDLVGRSVQSSLTMAEDYARFGDVEQRLRKMRGDLKVLGDLSTRASEVSDFDQVLTKALDIAIENTGADHGSLLLINSNSQVLGEKILRGLRRDPLNAIEIKGAGSLAYQLVQRREAILTNAIQDGLLYGKPSEQLKGFRGLASYPLVARSLSLGLMNLYTTRGGKEFGQEEELFLTVVANILGLYLLGSFYELKLKSQPKGKSLRNF